MSARFFDIAGYTVSLSLEDTVLWERLSNMAPFECGPSSDIVLNARQVSCIAEKEPEPLLVSADEGFPRITIGKTVSGKWFFTMAPLHNRPTSCI